MNIQLNKPYINSFKSLNGVHKRINSEKDFGSLNNESNDGRFTIKEAGKNFIKGVFSPLISVVKHPFITVGIVGITGLMCSLVPVISPILTIGFALIGMKDLFSGTYNAVKSYKNHNYDEAEKCFEKAGQGLSTSFLSLAGMKKSSATVKEAKLMRELNVKSLNRIEKGFIAKDVKTSTYLEALKENISLITTKEGLSILHNQFKPQNIILRMQDLFKFMFCKKTKTEVCQKKKTAFQQTEEFKVRKNESLEEIRAKAEKIMEESFDELGVDKQYRPKLDFNNAKNSESASFNKYDYVIYLNEKSYRNGFSDLADTISHECYHASKAPLRNILDSDEITTVIKDYLSEQILNGDTNLVIHKTGKSKFKYLQTPKIRPENRKELLEFVKKYLYPEDKEYTLKELKEMLKPVLQKGNKFEGRNRDFQKTLNVVAKYVEALQTRIKYLKYISTDDVYPIKLKNFDAKTKTDAVNAFKQELKCLESTIIFFDNPSQINNYTFCEEEKNAELFADRYTIKKLLSHLREMKNSKTDNPCDEAQILDNLYNKKFNTEYLKLGEKYIRPCDKFIFFNRISDKLLWRRLKKLTSEILDYKYQDEGFGKNVIVNKFEPYERITRHNMGQSVYIPLSVGYIAAKTVEG